MWLTPTSSSLTFLSKGNFLSSLLAYMLWFQIKLYWWSWFTFRKYSTIALYTGNWHRRIDWWRDVTLFKVTHPFTKMSPEATLTSKDSQTVKCLPPKCVLDISVARNGSVTHFSKTNGLYRSAFYRHFSSGQGVTEYQNRNYEWNHMVSPATVKRITLRKVYSGSFDESRSEPTNRASF